MKEQFQFLHFRHTKPQISLFTASKVVIIDFETGERFQNALSVSKRLVLPNVVQFLPLYSRRKISFYNFTEPN